MTVREPAELNDEFRTWLWEFEFYTFRKTYAQSWGVDQDAWWPNYPNRRDGFLEEILATVSMPEAWSVSAAQAEHHLLFSGPSGSAFVSLAFAQAASRPNCLIHSYNFPLSKEDVEANYRPPVEQSLVSGVVTTVEGLFKELS